MSEIIDEHFIQNNKKFYSVNHISFGTFIGGPFAAAYYLSQNALLLNKPDEYRKYYLGFGLLGIVLILVICFVPGMERFPSFVIPMSYTFVARYLAEDNQKRSINYEIVNGASYHPFWRTLLISILSLFFFVIIFFAFFLSVR